MQLSPQVEKFHKHLLALQFSGCDVLSQLLGDLPNSKSTPLTSEPDKILPHWQKLLSDQAEMLVTGSNDSQVLDATNKTNSSTSAEYQNCFNHWKASGEDIQSLQYLISTDLANRASAEGLKLTLIHLVIYSVLTLVGFLILSGPTLANISRLIRQLGIPTTSPLEVLLALQPYAIWLFFGLVGVIVGVAALLVSRSRSVVRGQSDQSYHWLRLAQRANMKATQISHPSLQTADAPIAAESRDGAPNDSDQSPLLKWATATDGHSANKANLFGLVQRLYLWLSHQRIRRMYQNSPRLAGVVIGSVMAFAVGTLLFYPLVQTLITVIDSAGLQR